MKYDASDQRADRAFLVGVDYGRNELRARLEALAEKWESEPWDEYQPALAQELLAVLQ
jgi:hypothetical protein